MSVLLATAAILWSSAQSPGAPSATSPLSVISACRLVTGEAARLACYDAAAAALERAVASKEVVVLSPKEVKQTRRSLFGFSVPKLPFLGSNDEGESSEIEAKLKSARSLGYGKWRLVLEDGATWETTEATRGEVVPGPGTEVRIKRGILGSYMINIAGTRGVKARRVS